MSLHAELFRVHEKTTHSYSGFDLQAHVGHIILADDYQGLCVETSCCFVRI